MEETLGERLRRLRTERGMSQIELSRRVGVTNKWISQIELGDYRPSADVMNKIALALEVPIRELLQDEEFHMEAVARIKLIEVLLESNQPDQAEPILESLEGNPELSENDVHKLHVHLAECRYQQKRYDDVLEMLLPFVEKLEAGNYHDAHLLAWIHNSIGKSQIQKHALTEALYSFRKAYDLTHRFPKVDPLTARISYNVGITLRRIGQVKKSIPYLERAGEFFRTNNDPRSLAYSIFVQGISHLEIKDFSRAIECFDQAKGFFGGLNLQTFSNKVQLVVASFISGDQDPKLALGQLQHCMEQFDAENDYANVVYVYSQMAKIHLNLDEFEVALDYLEKAEEINLRHWLIPCLELGEFYRTFAEYHFKSHDYIRAVEYASKSSDLFGSIGMIKEQIESLRIAINSYRILGDLLQALELSQRCDLLWSNLYKEGETL